MILVAPVARLHGRSLLHTGRFQRESRHRAIEPRFTLHLLFLLFHRAIHTQFSRGRALSNFYPEIETRRARAWTSRARPLGGGGARRGLERRGHARPSRARAPRRAAPRVHTYMDMVRDGRLAPRPLYLALSGTSTPCQNQLSAYAMFEQPFVEGSRNGNMCNQ